MNFVSIIVCYYKGVCAGQYAYASLREHVPGLHLLQGVNVCIVSGERVCICLGVYACASKVVLQYAMVPKLF